MARPRKGAGRRSRKSKREIKRVWSELELRPEIVIQTPAQAEQQRTAEVTPP